MPNEIMREFDNAHFTEIDGEQVKELITGFTVCGAEPIDYPETDGLLLYLKGTDKYICVDIGQDPFSDAGFYIQYAEMEKGAKHG